MFLSLPHAFLMIILSLAFPIYIYKDPQVEYSSVVLTLTSLRNNNNRLYSPAIVTLSPDLFVGFLKPRPERV